MLDQHPKLRASAQFLTILLMFALFFNILHNMGKRHEHERNTKNQLTAQITELALSRKLPFSDFSIVCSTNKATLRLPITVENAGRTDTIPVVVALDDRCEAPIENAELYNVVYDANKFPKLEEGQYFFYLKETAHLLNKERLIQSISSAIDRQRAYLQQTEPSIKVPRFNQVKAAEPKEHAPILTADIDLAQHVSAY
jgi:hypothetical protein